MDIILSSTTRMQPIGGFVGIELIERRPYCGHCIHIKPTYQTLYEFYYTSRPVPAGSSTDESQTSLNTFSAYYNFHFGALDCTAWGSACNEHKVQAYPTFVIYKDGVEVKRIEGTRDMAGLGGVVEEQLEAIRPGSRIKGGPKWPNPKDKKSPDFQAPKTVEEAKVKEELKDPHPELVKDSNVPEGGKTVVKATPKEAVASPSKTAAVKKEALKATEVKKKPARPARTPNPLGKSISLTAESFQNQVTMTQDPWFIKFYAPWCGHCQAMAPNWVQLAKEMEGKLNIGEVNCDIESRLCKEVRLRGYPTILFFRGGERIEYEGLRGLGDFVAYANKAIDLGAGVKDVDAQEFADYETKEEVIFLYLYDHATTSEDFAALDRLTMSLIGHARLVKSDSALLAERFKVTTWPRLLVSRDGRPTYYTALAPQEMRDFRRVLHWMQSVWLPIVPELTASNSREIMDGKLVVLGILSRERPDEFAMGKKEIKSAATEWMDREIKEFQAERQELRDSKQLRIAEAEDRDDQRALRAAKNMRINMDLARHKEVGFAWVDGIFWERWIRTTYGINVERDGEHVIINDEDVSTLSLNFLLLFRSKDLY